LYPRELRPWHSSFIRTRCVPIPRQGCCEIDGFGLGCATCLPCPFCPTAVSAQSVPVPLGSSTFHWVGGRFLGKRAVAVPPSVFRCCTRFFSSSGFGVDSLLVLTPVSSLRRCSLLQQNPRAAKALIAAQYNGVQIDVPAFEFGKTNETPEFLAQFPMGKVPCMATPNGPIYESNAMARYGMLLSFPCALVSPSPADSCLHKVHAFLRLFFLCPNFFLIAFCCGSLYLISHCDLQSRVCVPTRNCWAHRTTNPAWSTSGSTGRAMKWMPHAAPSCTYLAAHI
jgi:hypothetical protein